MGSGHFNQIERDILPQFCLQNLSDFLFRYDIHRMPWVNYRNPWIELGNYLPLKPDLQHTANRKQLQQIEFLRQFQTVKGC